MGGSLGSLNMAIYSFILMFSVILILLMIHRLYNTPRVDIALWFAGTGVLTVAAWIYTAGKHQITEKVKGLDVTGWNPYYIALFALVLAFMSAGTLAALDKKQKIAPYYTVLALILAVLVGYTATYGGVPLEIWTPNLFMILAVVSAAIMVLGPVYGFATKKMDIHAIWGALGWVVVFVAGFMIHGRYAPANEVAAHKANMDPAAVEQFTTQLANNQTIIYAVLLVAFLLLFLEQVLTDWKFSKKDK